MNKNSITLICCLALAPYLATGQELWTIGPMLHLNFGQEKMTTSFAIEAAYWNISRFPHSIDFALEFDRGKVRLYTEAQTGIGLAGLALGPVIEFNTQKHYTRLGIQGSVWANYFIGVDYRIRRIDKYTTHAPGIYGKLLIASSGFDESNSSSGWGDWDDWD